MPWSPSCRLTERERDVKLLTIDGMTVAPTWFEIEVTPLTHDMVSPPARLTVTRTGSLHIEPCTASTLYMYS